MRHGKGAAGCAATATAMLLVLGLAAAPPVLAKDGGEGRARGICSRGADWQLRAKDAGGRVEVRFEVDSDRRGQTWVYTIRIDGSLVASGRRTTGSSGSFRVERKLTDGSGANRVTAIARNPTTREYCRATLNV